MSRRKIMLLARSLGVGGAERQIVTLARGLTRRGMSVVVVVFYPCASLANGLDSLDCKIVSLRKRGRWDVLGFFARLLRYVRVERSDVVYSFLVVPNVVIALLRPLLRYTRIVWGVRASYMRFAEFDRLSRFSFWLSCRLARIPDLIVANSEAGKQFHIEHGYPAAKIRVVRNGIDVATFRPDGVLREAVRAEWDLASGAVVIGLVARLDPMKDHKTFLEAAAQLARKHPSARFVCVGDGPQEYKSALLQSSRSLGLEDRLVWTGTRADMHAIYNALDILTLSSFGEGFPNVVGEAMACGVPCVVTNTGDSATLVGDTGFVVPPESACDLADAWSRMMSQIGTPAHEERKRAARRRILENFTTERLVADTLEVLEELLD